jgi:acetyl-CoA carboxylase biotin carboxyl carrier protein
MKEKIKSLYSIMVSENISELEVNSKGYSVAIKRKTSNKDVLPVAKERVIHIDKAEIKPEKVIAQEKPEVAPNDESADSIKAPIAGMFYRSPAPTSPPFVSEGDIVEAGKVVCIIEAMKVMNEIKAPVKAKIIKICAENTKFVTDGQDIFIIEKL